MRLQPVLAALALTLANVAKPLIVDDAAYVRYARQIAAEPTDPYGFEVLWGAVLEPAFNVVVPPFLPYWLAGAMRLFGDEPLLWKLALFPFALALAASLQSLLARFAPGLATPLLWMAVLSPPVLPFLNLMLDLPAASLVLSALVLFLAACDRRSLACAVASGIAAGLATQTKYTGTTALAAILVCGALYARLRLALVATAIGVGILVGWEALMALRYGQSHLVHGILLVSRMRLGLSPASATVWAAGFAILVGALAAPVGLLGLVALRAPRRVVGLAALAVGLAYASIPFLPRVPVPTLQRWLLAGAPPEQTLFLLLGLATLASVAAVAWRLVRRREREDLLLVAWLAIEIAGFAALSPYLAARRVLAVSLAALLVCARELSRRLDAGSLVAAVRVPVAVGIAVALLFAATDFADAVVVRDSVGLAERELRALGADPSRETVWFTGHWGFQFYAERAGMRPVAPGRSLLRRGDWLVVSEGISTQRFLGQPGSFPITRADAASPLPWSTHPWAYAGAVPMRRRPEATLRLWIYRVKADSVAAVAPLAEGPK
jgi:hypothetical protein